MMKMELPWEPSLSKIKMAVSMDRNRMVERVVIAEALYLYPCLRKEPEGKALYDQERPLGSFLMDIKSEAAEPWDDCVAYPLAMALADPQNREDYENKAWSFLEKKCNDANPVSRFAAYLCRELCQQYLDSDDRSGTVEELSRDVWDLTRVFKKKLWSHRYNYSIVEMLEELHETLCCSGSYKDTTLEIYYPSRYLKDEWMVFSASFYAALRCYLQRLLDWDVCVCTCKECGKMFVASSKHYKLCSKTCRNASSQTNRRAFDERARKSKIEIEDKNISQRMRRRKDKLCAMENIAQDSKSEVEEFFAAFRKEAVRKKKAAKMDSLSRDFMDWLFEKEREFEVLCAEKRGERNA